MSLQSKIKYMDKLNAEGKHESKYTVANYITCRKFQKSTENSQLPQHLDARVINKLFHYLT